MPKLKKADRERREKVETWKKDLRAYAVNMTICALDFPEATSQAMEVQTAIMKLMRVIETDRLITIETMPASLHETVGTMPASRALRIDSPPQPTMPPERWSKINSPPGDAESNPPILPDRSKLDYPPTMS